MRLSVVHNFAADLGGRILLTLTSFALSITLVRYLGPAEYGRYAFALSLGTILVMVIDLGLNELVVRDVAKDSVLAGDYMTKLFGFRLVLSVPVIMAVPWVAHLLGKDPDSIRVATLVGTYLILFNGCTLFWSIWTGLHRLWLASLFQLLDRIAFLVVVLLCAHLALGLRGIVWGLVLTGGLLFLATVAGSFLVLIRTGRLPTRKTAPFFQRILREGWPLAVLALTWILVQHGERVILSGLRGDEALGLYSAAANLVLMPIFIPVAFANAFFPTLSRLVAADPAEAARQYEKVMGYLLLFGIGTAAGGILLSEPILRLVYGDGYLASARVFSVLLAGLPIAVPSKVVALLALALGRQKLQIWIYSLTIPIYLLVQAWAAAAFDIRTVAAVRVAFEWVGFGCLYVLVSRPFHKATFLRQVGQGLAAAAAMGVVLWPIRNLSVLVLIPIGAAIYAAVLFLLRAFDSGDLAFLRRIARRR